MDDPASREGFKVRMFRRDLERIPAFAFPAPYSLSWYQPGDERAWTRIHEEAEKLLTVTPELFRQQFGRDEALLARRQCYIRDAHGNAAGTASAWIPEKTLDSDWGRVHWVAIVPRCQGQGLAKPLMTAVLLRLKELGHTRAYLTTSTGRIPALRLYKKVFGFEPDIRGEADIQAWDSIRDELERR